MEEPHAAAAQDGCDRGQGGWHLGEPGVPDAAQHAGGGLQEDGGLVGDVRRQAEGGEPHRPLAHQHALAEAAGGEQVLAEDRAERLAAAPAEGAIAAGHVVRHDHPVARREAGRPWAQRLHRAHDLVAEHRPRRRRAVPQLEQVGAAEAGAAQAQEHLPGAGLGPRAGLHEHGPPLSGAATTALMVRTAPSQANRSGTGYYAQAK